MNTAANVHSSQDSHYYWPNGDPAYELKKKSGQGMKKPNITDARELGLLPSVTTILKVLDKPALNAWKTEQSVLAVLTSVRKPGEKDDEFVHRVLSVEQVQNQEASQAADKGTAIHDAVELCLQGKEFNVAWKPYVEGVLPVLSNLGKIIWTEKILVNPEAGYAGRTDIGLETERDIFIVDLKSTRSMPKNEPWIEARLQTASYAKCIGNVADKHVITGVIYISTVLPGAVKLFLNENWQETYERGFKPLLSYWQFANNYRPGSH